MAGVQTKGLSLLCCGLRPRPKSKLPALPLLRLYVYAYTYICVYLRGWYNARFVCSHDLDI